MMSRIIGLIIMFFGVCLGCEAQGLTRAQAEEEMSRVVDEWYAEVRKETDYITKRQAVVRGEKVMPLSCMVYGKLPEDGRSLFISLHGGGSAPKAVNDQQWQNQWGLYRPKEGVYICPRAAYDDWNMHFKDDVDEMYKDIIMYAYSHLNVNPDKVYVMGYSAGGDGVWRLAPRMADTWAAASMMAGHPGDVSLLNLRNLPFMVWCGAEDAAYDRNKLCAERIIELDSLHWADSEGYVHSGHIIEGKGHWMDRVDTAAVEWMAQYKRNPYPKRIVWRQEEVLKKHFYWLSVAEEEMQRGREVRVDVEGNKITIGKCDYKHITLHLNDNIVNLDKPVEVYIGKKRVKKAKLIRSSETMKRSIREWGDARYCFSTEIRIEVK